MSEATDPNNGAALTISALDRATGRALWGLMDRRRHGRYDLEAPLRFSWKGPGDVRHRAEGTIRNISVGGIFIFTDDPPPVGARVRFCVYFRSFLARSRLVMQTTAQVVRAEPSPQGKAPAGFAAALKTYILRNEKEVVEQEGF